MTAIPRASRGDRRAASRARRGEALDSATGTHGVRCCETAAAAGAGSLAGIARDAEARRRLSRASPGWGSVVEAGRMAAAGVCVPVPVRARAAPSVAVPAAIPVAVVPLPPTPVAGIGVEREFPVPVPVPVVGECGAVGTGAAGTGAAGTGAAGTGAAGAGADEVPWPAGRERWVSLAGRGNLFRIAGEIVSAAGTLVGSNAEWFGEIGVRRTIPPNLLLG